MQGSPGRCSVELFFVGDYFELNADSLVDFGKSGNVEGFYHVQFHFCVWYQLCAYITCFIFSSELYVALSIGGCV